MDVLTLKINVDPSSGHKVVNLRYELLQSIGQGQFGKVILARDKTTALSQYYAIKTINRIDTSRLITKTYLSHTTKIKREIRIMKECDHPNVVKLYQVIDDMKFDKILLVLEYCQLGEIDWKKYNHYHEKYYKEASKALPLNKILRDVVNGLQYLHQFKHIIHRDLKPSNLLISRDRSIKISDFGVSLILENNANDDKELGKTMGTPAFFAPELCQFVNKRLLMLNDKDLIQSKIDARIDIWSLGVILYCLFFHTLPFEGHNEFSLFKNIVNEPLKFPRTIESSQAQPQDIKEAELLKSLIRNLLLKDPSGRPTLEEIKAHPFTVFGLSADEKQAFKDVNSKIFKQQGGAIETDNSLTGRLRRLFIGKAAESTVSAKPMVLPLEDKEAPELVFKDLERVDDLLDSYLDDSDSSSMGSLEEANNGAQPIDTTNLLSSIENNTPKSNVPSSINLPHSFGSSVDPRKIEYKIERVDSKTEAKPESLNTKPKVSSFSGPTKKLASPVKLDSSSQKNVSPTRLRNPLGGLRSNLSSVSSKLNAPPPLELTESNFVAGVSTKIGTSSSDIKRIPSSGIHTPLSGTAPVTIGASSPLSIKSMFSPSRRFFSRLKKEKKPTIGSLASAEQSDSFTQFQPPPGVGGIPRTSISRRGLSTSVDSGSWVRKNSISSTGLNYLLKLSSSSSSLNLHAYLMDEPSLARTSTTTNSSNEASKDTEHSDYGDGVFHMSKFDDNFHDTTLDYKDHNFQSSNTALGKKGASRHRDNYDASSEAHQDYSEDADRTFSMDDYLEQLSRNQ